MIETAAPEASASALAAGAALDPAEFRAIAAILHEEARIRLPESKVTLVHSRLSRRLRDHGLGHFRDYVALVRRDAAERAVMVEALTTNHTHFFREQHHFDHLRTHVLPTLRQLAEAGQPVRIWSAGCSTGEEIYSIAMTLAEAGPDTGWLNRGHVKLLATDIAPQAVAAVARGVYDETAVRPIPPAHRARWLHAEGAEHRIADELRALVTARPLNLFADWPMRQQYDAIFCRNVMIYFDDAAKAELEARLVGLLRPGGHLYIGHSERLIGPATAAMRSVAQTAYVEEAA